MSAERLVLSDKYKAFLQCNAPAEFLEGTTAAGKTTVGLFKFMLKVAESPKKLHILAADDTGAAEKNIINKDLGILDDFGILVEYKGNGSGEYKMPHILFHTSGGDKIIFVVGYGNKRKWKDALGGQYGCLYIDEINTADIDFVREASMRCDYLMATLNPDDPSLDVYKEYINCSRPLPEWESETPQEIKDELKEEPKPSWVHWFFSFDDNAGLPEEKKQRIIQNTPKGTKIWKNKIQGLRGKASGLIFPNFDRKKHVVTSAWVQAPSDTAVKLVGFLEQCRGEWGFAKDVYVDNADQATMTELKKYKRLHGCLYNFWDAYKKFGIVDRIKLQLGWIQQGCYLVVDECENHLAEMEKYDHTINANQYSWIPYKHLIGFEEEA